MKNNIFIGIFLTLVILIGVFTYNTIVSATENNNSVYDMQYIDENTIIWIAPIENTKRYKAHWELKQIRQNTWAIYSLKVVDIKGIDDTIVLAESDSVWETASQLIMKGDSFDPSVDNFIGMHHNPNKQQDVGSVIIADGVSLKSDKYDITRGYIQQNHGIDVNEDGVTDGSYDIYHVFQDSKLRVLTNWNLSDNLEQKVTYGAMIPVTNLTNGGLSQVDISGKETIFFQNNGTIHYGSDPHKPRSFVFSNSAHSFELVATLPLSAPGRTLEDGPTWDYAELERVFVHDTLPTETNPNGLSKLYIAFSSGDLKPAVSSNHIIDYSVRLNK